MSNALTAVQPASLTDEFADIARESHDYAAAAHADNTRRAYQADARDFRAWCALRNLSPLPAQPATVIAYITELARTKKTSTIQRRLSMLAMLHQQAQYPDPTKDPYVHQVWRGIRRTKGMAQAGKAPAQMDDIRAMVETLPDSLKGVRDRALLLVGFAGAFRRSELVALTMKDVRIAHEGLEIVVRRSKTDQEGQGQEVLIPYGSNPTTCPVRALQAWLDQAQITAGAVFRAVNRHGQVGERGLIPASVALIVKRAAETAGLDPTQYAGHSLRAGLVTSAYAAGVAETDIMRQTRHQSERVARRYNRNPNRWKNNAAGKVGL